jgi:hypothetical protein
MAAAQLATRANFVDFDGSFLINNNPFEEPQLIGGCIQLNTFSGNGAIPSE